MKSPLANAIIQLAGSGDGLAVLRQDSGRKVVNIDFGRRGDVFPDIARKFQCDLAPGNGRLGS